jgi:hypothetical protein
MLHESIPVASPINDIPSKIQQTLSLFEGLKLPRRYETIYHELTCQVSNASKTGHLKNSKVVIILSK